MTSPEEGAELPAAKRTRWTFDDPCLTMERSLLPPTSTLIHDTDSLADPTSLLTFVDLIVVGVSDAEKDDLSFLPPGILSSLAALAEQNKATFGSKVGSKTPTLRMMPSNTSDAMQRYVLLGLGLKDDKDDSKHSDGFALGTAVAAICEEEKGSKSCLLVLPSDCHVQSIAKDFATSFRLRLYSDNRYRTGDNVKKPAQDLQKVYIATATTTSGTLVMPETSSFQNEVNVGSALADAQMLAMDIVNAPHNVLNSESLANLARSLATPTLTCRILNKQDCERRGMGAFLAVARGSETEPQLIHLTYTPPKGDVIHKKVGIVGKGVLFDTGGYNIKTSTMELMKFDCGGAAAVLGAAMAVDKLQPTGVEAHFIVAACENMISAKAYVPSDVLTASNGKTIEVINTDAEGRLTLADALVYADKEVGCDKIIDIATLTGSCIVSLGQKVCGIWTNYDGIAKQLEDISKETTEKSWRMPMEKEYNDQLKSAIADLKNCGTRWGGSITAALFLQHFVNKDKEWAHVDIAGTAWDWEKKVATGFGVRTLAEWICRSGKV